MKWKSNVLFEKADGMWIRRGSLRKRVEDGDLQIVELLNNGNTEDLELTKAVTGLENNDEVSAGLRLAQFVQDYGDFLDEGIKSRIIDA